MNATKRYKVKTNYGWGWRVLGAPECPHFGSQAEATRYAELRNDGIAHLSAWDRVEAERFAGAFGPFEDS
jgi:hypothetical protein